MYTFDETIVSDLHKDAYGWRPRSYFWERWESYNDDEKQAEWDRLLRDLNSAQREEEVRKQRARDEFEAAIDTNIWFGAADRQQAIRWHVSSMDISDSFAAHGADYVCYKLGGLYELKAEIEEACGEWLKKKAERFWKEIDDEVANS